MSVFQLMRRAAALAVAALVFGAASATAQDRSPPPRDAAQRDTLEQRVRLRMAQMLRNQLGMNDEQIRRFQATNRRFEAQRVGLFNQEREVRGELRQLIEAGDTTQHQRIGTLLDRTIQLQRQRIDLQEAEQKELATFLNPSQRARLYGIEEQLRRRMDTLRDGPPGGRMEPPPMRPNARPGESLGGRPGGRPAGGGLRRPPAR